MGTAENCGAQGAEFYRRPEVAEAYGARPGYPSAAIQLVVEKMALHHYAGKPPWRLLDAGCGTGQLTAALINGVPGAEIFAMDQSEAMILAFPQSIKDSVTPLVGDFDDMQFPDNFFDLITFGTALHWGAETRLPLELFRTLRPGGFIASISNVTRVGTAFTAILDALPNHAAKLNPMTVNPERIELGGNFSFVGFGKMANDLKVKPDDFLRLLASIELLTTVSPELRNDAMAKMQYYADDKNNIGEDGRIIVPFDTYVRIARAKVTGVGVLACQHSIEL